LLILCGFIYLAKHYLLGKALCSPIFCMACSSKDLLGSINLGKHLRKFISIKPYRAKQALKRYYPPPGNSHKTASTISLISHVYSPSILKKREK